MVGLCIKRLFLYCVLFLSCSFTSCKAANKKSIRGSLSSLDSSLQPRITAYRERMRDLVKQYPNLILCAETDKLVVALTFDDGPDTIITSQILDILEENKVKATFFVLGERVVQPQHQRILERCIQNNHEVLSHGWNHPRYSTKTEVEIEHDIVTGEAALQEKIGKHSPYMRPPYGDVDDRVINVLRKHELQAILWSIDSLDSNASSSAEIISDNVINNVMPGDIVIIHSRETKEPTVAALPIIIKNLCEQGYRFVTVSELLRIDGTV
ncbi:polysaccharide deacetylase family protein [Candidatus Dependentiae bacterium]|nr:polysaccharide deacetylase family protein [Candidatus Dependentiae bacterium]